MSWPNSGSPSCWLINEADMDDDDLEEEEEFDCGMMPDGTCQYAGTEMCDWECPYHNELITP